MKLNDIKDTYILSTGKRVYANRGLLSISDDGEVFEGYDGHVTSSKDDNMFTRTEREEIAVTVVARWLDWANLTGSDWIRRK